MRALPPQRRRGNGAIAFETAADHEEVEALRLRTVSWNVAAINNYPFEYWITHPNPSYKKLMERVEDTALQILVIALSKGR